MKGSDIFLKKELQLQSAGMIPNYTGRGDMFRSQRLCKYRNPVGIVGSGMVLSRQARSLSVAEG